MLKCLRKVKDWFMSEPVPEKAPQVPLAPEIRIDPCHCRSRVEHVRAGSKAEQLAWMESLKEDPGWRYLMRREHNKAVDKITRWSTTAMKAEELDQRNQDVLEAQVIFNLIQSLDECIAEAKGPNSRR